MNNRLVVVLLLLPIGALAQGSCEEQLQEVDRRIATGNYPDYNVQLARTMRDSLTQLCDMGMANEQMLDQMMDGFEDVLPVKSEEEKRAEREEKRKVAEASRNARKAAEAARVPPPSGLDNVSISGRPVANGFIDRSEDMLNFWAWDWDVHNGKARVLYETLPSRVQLGRPDWRTWVYVVETTPDGKSTQHVITSKQAHEHAALALRRGHDEVLLQRRTGPEGTPTTIERWSSSGRGLIASVPTPVASFPQGDKIGWLPFRGATSDGNVMFVSGYEPVRDQLKLVWYEASPEGQALGKGSLPIEAGGFTNLTLVPTKNGGGALPLMLGVNEEVVRQYGGSEVRATIARETRILTFEDDASSTHQSAAIERWVMPTQMDMNALQHMARLEHEVMANRTVESLNVGPHALPMIQPVGDSYVVLTRLAGNRSGTLQISGHWLVWAGRDRIEREVYLQPLADELNIKFITFTVTPNGEVALYGNSKDHLGTDFVVLLDKDGIPKATAVAKQPKNGKIEGMLADDSGVWLFGHGYPTDEFSRYRFWSERIEFY